MKSHLVSSALIRIGASSASFGRLRTAFSFSQRIPAVMERAKVTRMTRISFRFRPILGEAAADAGARGRRVGTREAGRRPVCLCGSAAAEVSAVRLKRRSSSPMLTTSPGCNSASRTSRPLT